MNVFFSHNSRQKPLVRELMQYLPTHVRTWLDENQLLVGDDLEIRIKDAIEVESDYLIIFIDDYSVKSEWVLRELSWALKREWEEQRNFVIPIVLEKGAWELIKSHEIGNKLYIELTDYSESSIKSLADKLTSQLFALLSRELELYKNGCHDESSLDVIDEAEEYMNALSNDIKLITFPYRKDNPLKTYKLFEILKSKDKLESVSWQGLKKLLQRLQQLGKLAGVVYDGDLIYIEEEHYSWKTTIYTDVKKRIAKKAISFINCGDTIALDAGSTTVEIANQIGFQLKMHNLFNLNVVTNSVSAANILLKAASDMGLEDTTKLINLYIIAGRVRCNTLAIVEDSSRCLKGSMKLNNFETILNKLGGADISFVGTNGIMKDVGFTTESLSETNTKSKMLNLSKGKFIVSDPSKFGIHQKNIFENFNNGVEIITTREDFENTIDDYTNYFSSLNTSIICA